MPQNLIWLPSPVNEERGLTGSLDGSAASKTDIPRSIDLYRAGSLMLDELLTRSQTRVQLWRCAIRNVLICKAVNEA